MHALCKTSAIMYNCFSLGQFSLFFPPRSFPHVQPTYIHTYVLCGSLTAQIYQAKFFFSLCTFFFFCWRAVWCGAVRCCMHYYYYCGLYTLGFKLSDIGRVSNSTNAFFCKVIRPFPPHPSLSLCLSSTYFSKIKTEAILSAAAGIFSVALFFFGGRGKEGLRN